MTKASRSAALVEQSPFFQAAGHAAMAKLLDHSISQILPRGAVLFEQGDEPDFVHMILEGSIGLQASVASAGKAMVEFFGAGEMLLVPAVVLQRPYLASAIVLSEARVLMIPAAKFREGITQSLELSRATNELLARHWRLMVGQVVDLKLRGAEERVASFLARRVSEEAGAGTVSLPESRSAIASRLGMTPETFSRVVSTLEKQGRIRRLDDGVAVADRASLTRSS